MPTKELVHLIKINQLGKIQTSPVVEIIREDKRPRPQVPQQAALESARKQSFLIAQAATNQVPFYICYMYPVITLRNKRQ